MRIGNKLRRIFDSKGVKLSWFADKIGLDRTVLYNCIRGQRMIPKQFWAEFIEFSQGELTLKDFLEDELYEFQNLEFSSYKDAYRCEVKMRREQRNKNENEENASKKTEDEI